MGLLVSFFLIICGFNLEKLRFWTLVREVAYVVYCPVYSSLCNLLHYTKTVTLLSSFSRINAGIHSEHSWFCKVSKKVGVLICLCFI